jgi:MFS family permease
MERISYAARDAIWLEHSQITLTFTITILALSCAAFAGGLWLNRSGPRVVAVTGGALYGLGVLLASFTERIEWLYATYGLLGGIGLGLGYIVPVTVLVKWFPDRRGLITGIAVGGFGAGALVTAPVATALIERVGVLSTFAWLGLAYFVAAPLAGWFMRNPPESGILAAPMVRSPLRQGNADYTLGQAVRTRQWWILWLILFLNVTAGISLISQQAPLYQELAGVSAAVAAGMVGLASIGNALGRVFWAWSSDYLTRRATFVLLFLIQVALFWVLPGSRLRRHAYPGCVCNSELFWWWVRDDACGGDRLLRSAQRRPHLWLDAIGLGSRKPVWSHAARGNAGGHRVVSGCVAHYRCANGLVGCASVHPPLAADAAANFESARADETRCRDGKRLLAPRKMMLTGTVV